MIDIKENDITGVKVKHFKCFGDEAMGFETIKPFNVIIGRNNSGKSSLLDLLDHFITPSGIENVPQRGQRDAHFLITKQFSEAELIKKFGNKFTIGMRTNYRFDDWWRRNLLGKEITVRLNAKCQVRFYQYGDGVIPDNVQADDKEIFAKIQPPLSSLVRRPFADCQYRRLLSDRDISPEAENGKIQIAPNGTGFTSTLQTITHDQGNERDIVEVKLLDDLNSIFAPDARFTRILIERDQQENKWEVFLEEERKGRVPLSQMGSGVKTVLLVLAFLEVLPLSSKFQNRKNTVFAFEELENNLHPAMQRRLFRHLYQKAKEYESTFFTTTHSNVVIDMFYDDPDSQIVHVVHDGESSTVKRVDDWAKGGKILDDLDFRASDILQSNGIVWVEGPSDRMYFRHWVDLWAGGELIEGVHYQCLLYGGSCNAHMSLKDPDEVDQRMAAYRVNRKAIILADSDKRKADTPDKIHTERLRQEIIAVGGYAWVTQGKEVENYLPLEALKDLLDDQNIKGPGELTDMFEYIKKKKDRKGTYSKTALAGHMIPLIKSKEMLADHQDMATRLDEVVELIKKWNRME